MPVFLAVLLFCLSLCAPQAQAESKAVTVIDALGREVTINRPPQRIVTIFSSNTELVTSLGLIERIVGIDAYTYYPDGIKAKPAIGGRLGFSLEKIIAQNPDLVIMTPARQASHQLLAPLEKLGVPTVVLQATNIDEIMHNIQLVATITGVSQRGKELVSQLQTRLAHVSEEQKAHFKRPRVIMITGKVGNGLLLVARPQASTTTGYTSDAIVKAGGILALDEQAATGPVMKQISPEVLLASDPDILLYTIPKTEMDALLSLPGWQAMKAVQNREVHHVISAQLLIQGPRIVDGIEHMAGLFQQWGRKQ